MKEADEMRRGKMVMTKQLEQWYREQTDNVPPETVDIYCFECLDTYEVEEVNECPECKTTDIIELEKEEE
jgi:hypothetical protein